MEADPPVRAGVACRRRTCRARWPGATHGDGVRTGKPSGEPGRHDDPTIPFPTVDPDPGRPVGRRGLGLLAVAARDGGPLVDRTAVLPRLRRPGVRRRALVAAPRTTGQRGVPAELVGPDPARHRRGAAADQRVLLLDLPR